VVKAQVLVGGRGKAGGVRVARTEEEATRIARALLGSVLQTHQGSEQVVDSLLLEEAVPIGRELYWACLVDRDRARAVLLASPEGGVEIEELARHKPEAIFKRPFDPDEGLRGDLAAELARFLQIEDPSRFESFAKKAVEVFVKSDLLLLEINPLAEGPDGSLFALDAKVIADQNAAFRQDWLPPPATSSPLERQALSAGLSWVDLGGDVACLVNGAGLAMATADAIHFAGGKPANFLDIGGAADKERMETAFRLLLSNTKVKSVLVNVFGGIVRCDLVARALVDTLREFPEVPPIVVRLEGTAIEEARAVLKGTPGLHVAESFDQAARLAVDFASGRNPNGGSPD